MQYIRTKDGIWKYNQKKNSAERPNKEFSCNQIWLNIKEKDIIAQADAIEELCDEFVIINENALPKPIIILSIQLKDYKNETIYGAIWTDKGLKYVAKMNEKGELELL